MKKLIKVVYALGILFWASFLIYGLARMAAYNGFGNHYSFKCKSANDFVIIEEANSNLKITYSYDVLGKIYKNDERISRELFKKKVGSVSEMSICYNSTYPSLSYIREVNIAVSREKTAVVVSLVFLILIYIIYIYAKRDY